MITRTPSLDAGFTNAGQRARDPARPTISEARIDVELGALIF
jgi:hypothetical protein